MLCLQNMSNGEYRYGIAPEAVHDQFYNACTNNSEEDASKDEDSATNADSYSSMFTSRIITQLSSCSDHIPVDSDSVPVDSSDNVPADSSKNQSTVDSKRVQRDSQNVQEADVRDAVSAANRNICSNSCNAVPYDSKDFRTCTVCNKRLHSRSMKHHMRTHSGTMPYSCDVCSRQFCHSGTFNRHRRSHTGERPFTCQVCSRKFSGTNDLRVCCMMDRLGFFTVHDVQLISE